MDDLEKAILISFDESGGVNSVLKQQAVAYIQQIKENPSLCNICTEKLCFSKLVQVQFWCLQCLHEVLRIRYSSMSEAEKLFIRESIFTMACGEPVPADSSSSVRILDSPAYIRNKFAQVVVTLIYFEYPLIWPSIFVDFLPNLSKGAVVIDMFCRILNVLDDELISMDYPGTDVAVSGRIKDAMRAQCVPQIVGAWYDIVMMYKNLDPDLCSNVLDSMRRYILWIDIGLVANVQGFSERLVTATRPGIGLMFKKTLDILLQILVVFPKTEPLWCKVTSFIHRMVDTLGTSVFPYLPNALGQLLTESESKELGGFLVLLNQLICKFGTEVSGILDEVYPVIANRVFNILPRNDIQEIRELQDLQRKFFTFLHVIATHDLSYFFLSHKSNGYLDMMMQLLLYTCCNHKDILVRKACVQIFIRLIKDWCTAGSYGKEKVPGFKSFILESFATNCCLYSVLDKSFEFDDANTVVLFGEIVMAQKVMYEKFGNDFLLNFVSKGFPNVHCPQDLAEQYCQKLQGNDSKALKSFYQSLIEKLRPRQNGSLVFR
ncbi:hypothetical protein OROGR_005119 [Orobanche gracilis]